MSGWRPEFPEFIEKQREAEKQAREKREVQRIQQQANTEAAQEAAFDNRLAAALVKPMVRGSPRRCIMYGKSHNQRCYR